jgi:hypothetical protein
MSKCICQELIPIFTTKERWNDGSTMDQMERRGADGGDRREGGRQEPLGGGGLSREQRWRGGWACGKP